jgi:hypothetical protein
MKRILVAIVNIAIVATIFWMGFEMLFGARIRNSASKDALRQIHKEISIGNSQDIVSSVYERNKTDRTVIKKDIFTDTWVIRMPFELGATDPILYVQFGTSGRVTGVAMRTSDGIHLDPPSDYQDKGTFNPPKQ